MEILHLEDGHSGEVSSVGSGSQNRKVNKFDMILSSEGESSKGMSTWQKTIQATAKNPAAGESQSPAPQMWAHPTALKVAV